MEKTDISALLIAWYEKNRRELPWRETSDPYRIWISEVILQQTRVAQGLGYYERFTARFPDVAALAAADEDEVLKLWQGLGYYSRARNLHAAARQVIGDFGGKFPETMEGMLSLQGVGRYTAAAVCSIAYGEPLAVVDGNVYRVLSRLFAVDLPIDSTPGQRYFAELAQSLLDVRRPGLHNQAVMELGALQCVPKSPDCRVCPLRDCCLALAGGRIGALPVKTGKTRVRPRYFNYLHIHDGNSLWLSRRGEGDIWQGLYEFPLIETEQETEFEELRRTEAFFRLLGNTAFRLEKYVEMPRHQLSHQTLYARFYRIAVDGLPQVPGLRTVPFRELHDYAVSRLTEMYLDKRDK